MPATAIQPEADVIELEPSGPSSVAEPWTVRGSCSPEVPVAVAPEHASPSSLATETLTLRRTRLAATALLLAVTYAVLAAWHLFSRVPHSPAAWFLLSLRFVLPAAIAAILMSRLVISSLRARVLEFALFGGLTTLVFITQYTVNFALRGNLPAMVAFIKNGVIQMVVLMMLYGTFIPNRPKTVAWAVLAMALAPLFGVAFLTEHAELASFLEQLRSVEQTGSNALFLAIAAGMAIYVSTIVNGLRTELHEAHKFGQYQLVRKLGEGGMGEVYLAEHQLLKRPCALKLIKPEKGSNPIAVARFEREVQSAARLSHPNTIEIYDYGHTSDGTFYYVMEYLRGMSLADLVRVHGPVPAGRLIYLMRQVCAGLAEAHALGLVHRDLKPANVFVAVRGGEADVAKVLDFGLVKLTRDLDSAELTGEMAVSGTPTYMAPEQALGDRSLDARADIYSLGVLMYTALTGSPPFKRDNAFAIMMAHARDPVVPPSQICPAVPGDLEQVVLRCLAKRPDGRYPSVKALDEALSSCASARDWGPNRAAAWWTAQGADFEDAVLNAHDTAMPKQ
jgi:eukaryotic-like serine/threonine-protein kinase